METHSSILAWEIPWTEEPGGLHPWGHRRVKHDLAAVVKNSAANAGDIRFLGWEDPLEEETATRSSKLAWRIP